MCVKSHNVNFILILTEIQQFSKYLWSDMHVYQIFTHDSMCVLFYLCTSIVVISMLVCPRCFLGKKNNESSGEIYATVNGQPFPRYSHDGYLQCN